MNLLELHNSLLNKEENNLYIFFGKEYAILEIYIKKVSDMIGIPSVSYEAFASVYKTLDKKDMFAKGKQLILIREDKDFLSAENMWKDLMPKLKKKGIILILKYSIIDQRSKFYKTFTKQITEFTPLSNEVLTKYIKKEIDISDSACQYLCEITSNDYGRILLETDKVKNFAQYKNISHMDAFKQCYEACVFHIDAEGEVYDLINAIMYRDIKNIYLFLQESKDRKDNPIMILSLLHNNVKALLQIQLAGNVKDLSEKTGLTGFQIKNSKQFTGKYTNKELVRFMKYIKYCEKSIKNGILNADTAIDYLLINVL